jgi:transposase
MAQPPGQVPVSRRHYSRDLKERVVYQRYTLGLTTTEISKNLDMSLHVVQCVLKLWDEIGSAVKDPKTYGRQGRACLLDTRGVEVGI